MEEREMPYCVRGYHIYIVSFPDPAFKLDKGLAHFARNLGLPDLAGKE